MIKILHVVGVMNRAGLETFIMNMYRSIDKNEFSFNFLCLSNKKGDYDEEILEKGGRIFRSELCLEGGPKRHLKNYKGLKSTFVALKKEYDIIHIHNYHAFDAYLISKAAIDAGAKKVIVHSHSTSAEFHICLHKIFRRFLKGLNIYQLACSEKAGQWLFSSKNTKVVYNGIDANKFRYNESVRLQMRKELEVDDKFVIGHVGRFEAVKNQKYLCELLPLLKKAIPNVILMFIGDGIELDNVKQYCVSNNLDNVRFMGSRDNISDYCQAFDIFAFPSIFEGIPLSIIEAQTSGLPCVVSSGVPNDIDIVPNVFHIPLDNKNEWVEQIFTISKHFIDRHKNYDLIVKKGYDINTSCKELEDYYRNLL